MPIVPFGSAGDIGGGVPAVEFNLITDVAGVITTFQCINRSEFAAYGMIKQDSNGREYKGTFQPNQETNISVPTGQAQRIIIEFDERGHILDTGKELIWPYP